MSCIHSKVRFNKCPLTIKITYMQLLLKYFSVKKKFIETLNNIDSVVVIKRRTQFRFL